MIIRKEHDTAIIYVTIGLFIGLVSMICHVFDKNINEPMQNVTLSLQRL